MRTLRPVAVDAMGGDHAPDAVVEGACRAARDGTPVTLVGDAQRLRGLIASCARRVPAERLQVVDATDAIPMDAAPGVARNRPQASVRRTLALVGSGACSGAVCCGNTGAVLMSAVIELGTLEGAARPAVATLLPRRSGGHFVLLDAGANVDCRPELLASFARLGAAWAEVSGIRDPRVGLLSNGEEEGKGNAQVKATLGLLRELPLGFVGPVEPPQAMEGRCDVLVCDGFVGNVLLKSAEGAVGVVVDLLKQEIRRRPSGVLGALLLRGAFRRFRARVAWDATGGALLLGTNGVVVVGHGRANAEAVRAAVHASARYAQADLVGAMRRRLVAR